jgi:hypothetical protein
MNNTTPAQEELERFRRLVLGDLSLQEQLRQTTEMEPFITRTVLLAHERGFDFTDEEVRTAMRASRLAWMQRWL